MAASLKRDIRSVAFGKADDDIREWLGSMPPHFRFSHYVRELIRRDMNCPTTEIPRPVIELEGEVQRKEVQLSKEQLETNFMDTILGKF